MLMLKELGGNAVLIYPVAIDRLLMKVLLVMEEKDDGCSCG